MVNLVKLFRNIIVKTAGVRAKRKIKQIGLWGDVV